LEWANSDDVRGRSWHVAGLSMLRPPTKRGACEVKDYLNRLVKCAIKLDKGRPPVTPEDVGNLKDLDTAEMYVRDIRSWAMKLLEAERQTADTPISLPSEGSPYTEENAPPEFREGGKPNGAVLTGPYLKNSPNWVLGGSYLTKHYGEGKELTTHIMVGRAKAYRYLELLVLRDRKTENEKDDTH